MDQAALAPRAVPGTAGSRKVSLKAPQSHPRQSFLCNQSPNARPTGTDFSSSQQALFPSQCLYFQKVAWKMKRGAPPIQKNLPLASARFPPFWQTLKLNTASLFISSSPRTCTSLLSSGSNLLAGKNKDCLLLHKPRLVTRGERRGWNIPRVLLRGGSRGAADQTKSTNLTKRAKQPGLRRVLGRSAPPSAPRTVSHVAQLCWSGGAHGVVLAKLTSSAPESEGWGRKKNTQPSLASCATGENKQLSHCFLQPKAQIDRIMLI